MLSWFHTDPIVVSHRIYRGFTQSMHYIYTIYSSEINKILKQQNPKTPL